MSEREILVDWAGADCCSRVRQQKASIAIPGSDLSSETIVETPFPAGQSMACLIGRSALRAATGLEST
ncbi:MAG TPA: hypothetical protein DCX79_14150 [Planctomycetaceae bacterium]|nr:hypothetical protein [Planctomycetaceae bacterium]